jgi:hypothetical protein
VLKLLQTELTYNRKEALMSKLTGLLIALFVAGAGSVASAADAPAVVAATATTIPASLACRTAVKGETPTATAADSTPLVCKRIDVKLMVAEMQDAFMMPVGIDWMSLLQNRDYDQGSR